jgi:integrase
VLALDATTVRVLRRYREEQERWYRGHGRIPSGYVFTSLDGGPMSPDYLTQTFAQLVKASGLPPVRLHDLRHGAASLALAAGVDLKVVADQLGHCSIVLTADNYVNPRELHQPGEKPQVSRSRDGRSSVPLALMPAR